MDKFLYNALCILNSTKQYKSIRILAYREFIFDKARYSFHIYDDCVVFRGFQSLLDVHKIKYNEIKEIEVSFK